MWSLFRSHLDFAKFLWLNHLQKFSSPKIIDATAGNGNDSLSLAQQALVSPVRASPLFELHLIDIQENALSNSRQLLHSNGIKTNCYYHHASHASIGSMFSPNSIHLIVYNLGYLPGGDKNITTQASSSELSILQALDLLTPGGLMTIMFYPGHAEGAQEQKQLLPILFELPKTLFSVSHHVFSLRATAPGLLVVQKTAGFSPQVDSV